MDVGQMQSGESSPGHNGIGMSMHTPSSSWRIPTTDIAPPRRRTSDTKVSILPLNLYERLKKLVVHNILQLDGSPHSIALGVFIGFVIGMTPTIGIQMVTYFATAALTRANRFSGLLPVWLSNPLTAVPLYYFNWRVGLFVMTGQASGDGESQAELASLISNAPGADLPLWERLTSADFWNMLFELFVALGVELWVGCLVVGLVTGVLGYWATYVGVKAYRRRLAQAPR